MSEGYASPIVGGAGALIRDSIRSRNYSPGVSGWAIFANGAAEFLSVIIRGTLSSPNYVPGVSGWNLDSSGAAELNSAIVRGKLATDITGARVEIYDATALPPPNGQGAVDIYTGNAAEVTPAQLRSYGVGGPPILTLRTSDIGAGYGQFRMDTPTVAGESGDITFGGTGTGPPFGLFNVDGREVHIPDYGIACPTMRHAADSDSSTRTTASTTFVAASGTAALTMTYPPSGIVTVSVSSRVSTAGGAPTDAGVVAFEIRDTNAAGTLRFAASDVQGGAAIRPGALVVEGSKTWTVSGLPTGGVMFVRPMYRASNAASAASFLQTTIAVMPSP